MGGGRGRVQRPSTIDCGRERLVVDFDQGGRVLRPVRAVRDHRRHRLADITNLSVREDRRIERMPYRARRLGQRHGDTGQVGAEILQGEDRPNSRRGLGGRRVDPANPRMSLAASDESGVQQIGEPKIVDETGPPPQKRRVLDPRDPLSKRHGLTQPPST